MNGGRLRHEITIQRFVPVTNEYGEEQRVWSDLVVCRAEITPISGKEDLEEKEKKSAVDSKILIRYPGIEIKPTDRVLFGSIEYNIIFVQNYKNLNRDILLLVKEKVDEV